MSDSQEKPWSDNPNAPAILYELYYYEKTWLAGNLLSPIFYGTYEKSRPHDCLFMLTLFIWLFLGIVVFLFFRCVAALFNPDHRRGEPIAWGLVSYTVVMFLLVTVGTVMQLNVQSISYIDNREFPGVKGVLHPGPIGYQGSDHAKMVTVIQDIVFILNNWLADGCLVSPPFAFTHLGV